MAIVKIRKFDTDVFHVVAYCRGKRAFKHFHVFPSFDEALPLSRKINRSDLAEEQAEYFEENEHWTEFSYTSKAQPRTRSAPRMRAVRGRVNIAKPRAPEPTPTKTVSTTLKVIDF